MARVLDPADTEQPIKSPSRPLFLESRVKARYCRAEVRCC